MMVNLKKCKEKSEDEEKYDLQDVLNELEVVN